MGKHLRPQWILDALGDGILDRRFLRPRVGHLDRVLGKSRLKLPGEAPLVGGEGEIVHGLHLLQHQVGDRAVRQDLVSPPDELDIVGGAAHQRGALRDVEHPFVHLVHLGAFRRPDVVPHLGIGRHHVRRFPAARHHAVDAGLGDHVLPEVVHAHVHQHYAVEGAASLVRHGRGMGGDAVEVHPEGIERERRTVPDQVRRAGMPGDGGVEVVEDAVVRHEHLAHHLFFRGTAVIPDRAADAIPFHRTLQGLYGTQARRTEEIVAAAVAGSARFDDFPLRGNRLRQAGQCIVLAQEPDYGISRSPGGDEGRFHPAGAPFDGKAVRFQLFCLQFRRVGLLQGDLRMVPDVPGHAGQVVVLVAYVVDDQFFRGHGRASPVGARDIRRVCGIWDADVEYKGIL